MKNVAVLTEDVAFALFFRPHPGDLPSKAKKKANARGSAWGRGGLGGRSGLDGLGGLRADGIDRCITAQVGLV